MAPGQAKVKIGIVGIGFGQQVHLPAFRSDSRCEVVALCASSDERARGIADRHGVARSYGDWRALLEAGDIDAISIAVPPALQVQIIPEALNHGKPVFCEKPFTVTATQANDLAQYAERLGHAHMIDLEFPDVDAWQQAKAILDSGEIGALRHAVINWNVETYANQKRFDSWKTRPNEGGGTLNSFVSHSFYYFEWLLGKISRLSARLGCSPGDTRGGDTLAVLCLELQSGAIVSLSVSGDAFRGNGHRLELYGDQGALVLDNRTSDYVDGFELRVATRANDSFEKRVPATPAAPGVDGRVAVVSRLAARFLDWLDDGKVRRPNFWDGYRTQVLLDAARQSSDQGCWVNVPSENSWGS